MTNNTQPEALRLANALVSRTTSWVDKEAAAAELRRQHARIAELEAQLEAVGAGGVQALSAAPAGWKLVPVEPTKEMVAAACREHGYPGGSRSAYVLGYKSMLAASPTPPAEQQATKETSGGFHVWRDISTAPKDGSRFVATGHNYGLYSEVRHTCVAQWFRGCWMEVSDWNETSELKYLTHWMPLPSPPDDVAAPAEQQAATKAAPVKACVCGEPQASGTVHRVDGPCYVAAPQQEAQESAGKYLTVVYRDLTRDEAQALIDHEKMSAASWSHALHERDMAKAAPQQKAQEPVAWLNPWRADQVTTDYDAYGEHGIPLYTAPQPAPAPLSEREVFEATWEKAHGKKPVLWETMFAQQKQEIPPHCVGRYFYRDAQTAWKAWQARAALAAQGGKE